MSEARPRPRPCVRSGLDCHVATHRRSRVGVGPTARPVARGARPRARHRRPHPSNPGAYREIGMPWLGASASRTLRGMTVSNTRSPRYRRASAATSADSFVRRVIHRQRDALDDELRVQVVTDEVEGGKQLGQSFQGVVLALQRDKDRIGGGQGVHRQQSERRWTVDEDVVVFVDDLGQKPAESSLPPFDRRELYLGPGQRDRRRDQGEPIVDRHPKNELGQVRPIDDGVVHGPFDGVTSEAKPARRVPLGVEIDDEDSFARSGEIAPQVDDRRGLADAALLVRAGDRLAHSVSCSDGSHDAQFYHRWPSDLRSGAAPVWQCGIDPRSTADHRPAAGFT